MATLKCRGLWDLNGTIAIGCLKLKNSKSIWYSPNSTKSNIITLFTPLQVFIWEISFLARVWHFGFKTSHFQDFCQFSGVSISVFQGTFNCGILVSLIGGSGDPRRKWEEMGERERERERERGRERECWKVLLLFAKWSKRTIEMQEVYLSSLKKPGLRHLLRLSKKVEHTL